MVSVWSMLLLWVFLLYELPVFVLMLQSVSSAVMFFFVLCTVWTLFYFSAIRSYDRQVEINTYLLTYFNINC